MTTEAPSKFDGRVCPGDPVLPPRPEGFRNRVLTVIPRNVLEQTRNHPLLETLHITDIGFYPRAYYHYRERSEGSEQHILIYCVRGEGFIETATRRQVMCKDSVLLIPSGVGHIYGSLTNDPWHIYWAHYTGSHSHHYNRGPADDFTVSSVPFSKYPDLSRQFHRIFNLLDRGTTVTNLIHCAHILGYTLTEFFYANCATGEILDEGGDTHHHVDNTISYLQSRIHDSITLDELAAWSNVSKGHLTQLFKEKTSYSPIRFFINLKMQQACRYLDLTDMTIKQVAVTMGYSDPYYFSRLFRRTIGMSPSDYRSIKKG